jgi:hypothetical protein
MEEKLRRAFQLAYFILREEQAALVVTRESVSALDVMLFRQDKRVHYLPSHRTKVSLGEWQMLQRLVYFASEPEEMRQEEHGVSEEALVMHYIKHLVYITGRRNSFFVALGLSRLLHNYTTAETAQIHELVSQDPDRGRDDSYYRRRKAQLMRELQDRFGGLLAVQRGARGEERFQALLDAQSYLAWVRECLREFTPWETSCNLPAAFDPHTDELPSLCFRGDDPDGEHEIEIRRLHSLLHPDCFGRLLSALRLDAPDKRLEVPEFKLRDHSPPEPPSGGRPPTARLSEEDMESLKKSITQEREHRRRFSPTLLSIVVDRVERARWPIEQIRSPQVEIAPDDGMIEIYGVRGGENIRLAAHMLSYDSYNNLRPVAATLTLEGGQELRLAIEPLRAAGEAATGGKEEEYARAKLAVTYRETVPRRILLWEFSRLRLRLFNSAQLPIWKPAMAFLLLISSGAAVGYWLWNRQPAPGGNPALNVTLTPRVSPTTAAITSISPQPGSGAAPTPLSPAPKPLPPLPVDEVIAVDIRPRAGKPDGPGELVTRGAGSQSAGLLEAKKIYLEISGARREQARRIFLQRLPAGASFSLTDNQDEADVALKVSLVPARQDRLALTIYIMDPNGKVIWPLTAGATARKYEGPLEKVIETFSRDLAGDIQRLERQK